MPPYEWSTPSLKQMARVADLPLEEPMRDHDYRNYKEPLRVRLLDSALAVLVFGMFVVGVVVIALGLVGE